jgi:class 3 adenylate cyclase
MANPTRNPDESTASKSLMLGLWDRIKNFILGISIRYKIIGIMVVTLGLAILLISSIQFSRQKALMLSEMKSRGTDYVNTLCNAGFQSIVNKDKLVSSDTITAIMGKKGVVYCIIADKTGKIQDSSVAKVIGTTPGNLYSRKLLGIRQLAITNLVRSNSPVLDIANPIQITYKEKTAYYGYALVSMDWGVVENEIKRTSTITFLLAILFLVIGGVISVLFAQTITGPIFQMVGVMKKIGEGDLNQNIKVDLLDEIGKLADAFNTMIQGLREKMMMSKYISKSAQEMIKGREDTNLKLGGERKEVTMFFSDIRGFTSYSEKRSPEEVITMLNTYLSEQADIITKNGGSIDKYVGDEVVAMFEGDGMVERTLKSAVQIQNKVKSINKQSGGTIALGVGINTGEVVLGNMGSKDRMDYTVIGDNVNAAARLCSSAERDEILVSESSYKLAKNKDVFSKPKMINVKGKELALKVYSVKY